MFVFRNAVVASVQFVVAACVVGCLSGSLLAQDADSFEVETGFESLFNGKDLTGWNILPTSEEQKKRIERRKKKGSGGPAFSIFDEKIDLDGKAKSDDGRFVADGKCLVVTVPAEGRRIQSIHTIREFGDDFTLKLEFRAANNADSGVFIRGKQLQCRDFPNAGPYKDLKKFKPEDWNELVVVVTGNTAHCTCNGEVLEAELSVPESGPIGLEGDRGKLEYRRIRISTSASAADYGMLKPTNDVESWTFETTADGKGSIKSDGDAIVFETTATGDENWHVQAYQTGLDLVEGAEYTVSFEIKSPDSSLVLLQAMINEEDWHEIGLHEEIYTGKEYKAKEFSFTAYDVVKGNNRIGFVLGDSTGSVSVKNFKLEKK